MAKNRIFIPQVAMDAWMTDGAAEMRGQNVLLKKEQRTFRMAEGVRILREVSGEPDQNELVGKCKTRAYLRELGAQIIESSMVLDNNAYDVEPGFLGTPVSAASLEMPAVGSLSSDEQLLADFLAKKM